MIVFLNFIQPSSAPRLELTVRLCSSSPTPPLLQLTAAPRTGKAQCSGSNSENYAAGDVKRKGAPAPGSYKIKRLARKGRECGKAATETYGERKPHALAPAEPHRQRTEKPDSETPGNINHKRRPREERRRHGQPSQIPEHAPAPTRNKYQNSISHFPLPRYPFTNYHPTTFQWPPLAGLMRRIRFSPCKNRAKPYKRQNQAIRKNSTIPQSNFYSSWSLAPEVLAWTSQQLLIIQLSYLLFLSRISRRVATSVISATSEIILSLNVYRGQFAFVRSVSRLLIFTPYRSW